VSSKLASVNSSAWQGTRTLREHGRVSPPALAARPCVLVNHPRAYRGTVVALMGFSDITAVCRCSATEKSFTHRRRSELPASQWNSPTGRAGKSARAGGGSAEIQKAPHSTAEQRLFVPVQPCSHHVHSSPCRSHRAGTQHECQLATDDRLSGSVSAVELYKGVMSRNVRRCSDP